MERIVTAVMLLFVVAATCLGYYVHHDDQVTERTTCSRYVTEWGGYQHYPCRHESSTEEVTVVHELGPIGWMQLIIAMAAYGAIALLVIVALDSALRALRRKPDATSEGN